MFRSTLPLLGACLLALSSCGSSTETKTTTDATGPSADSTPAMAAAPAGADSSATDMAPMAGKADPNGPTAPHSTDAEFMRSAAHSG